MDMAPLQDYMTGLNAVSSKAKLEDYFKDAPVREAERGSKIATADAVKQTILREKLAGVDASELTNQFNRATQSSRIATELMKVPEAERKAQLDQIGHAFSVANTARARVAAGEFPGIVAAELGDMAKNPVVQMAMTNPKQYALLTKDYTAAMDTFNPQYRNDRQKHVEEMEKVRQMGKNAVAAAGARTGAEREHTALLKLAELAAGGDANAQRILAEYSKAKGGVGRVEGADVRAAAGAKADVIKDYVTKLSNSMLWGTPAPTLPPGTTEEDVKNYLKTNPMQVPTRNVGGVVKNADGSINVDKTLELKEKQNKGK